MSRCGREVLTPPARHEREHPLPVAGQVLQEDGGIKDEVPTTAKRAQTYEEAQDNPVRTATRHDREDGADQQAHIEREASSDDVRTDT